MEISKNPQIHELPKQVADKIAAGEVVDRPVSIVKELLENAIDAGATSITVEIKNGGKTYLRVTDNGCGILREQAELAFKRHATSKIVEAEDLDRIETLGFRGEALASISAVSRAELITKTRDADSGYKLRIEGGEFVEKADTGCPDGTTLVISDLFYNTPARMKFLKPDNTESTLIIDFVSKMALAYPSIKIRLINNGNILFSTPGKGDIYTNILTIYSREIGERLIRVDKEENGMKMIAFVSPPSQSKTNRKSQIFFVNGRSVGSKVLDHAVTDAYAEKLFEGRYPIAFLFLSVMPERLDVNIHPNKKEVRFDDEKSVRLFVASAIREALSTKEAVPEIKQENIFKNSDWRGEKPADAKNAQLRIEPGANKAGVSTGADGRDSSGGQPIEPQTGTVNVADTVQSMRGGQSSPNTGDAPSAQTTDGELRAEEKAIDIKSFLSIRPREAEKTTSEKKAADVERPLLEPYRGNLTAADERSSYGTGRNSDADIFGEVAAPKGAAPGAQAESAAFTATNGTAAPPPLMELPEPPARKPFDISSLRPTGAIFNTYITAVDDECFYLIDQHAAHERIFYEQLLEAYNREERHSQMLLTSFVVEMPFAVKNNAADFLVYLERIGYHLEEFGLKAYVVKEIPAMMELSEAEDFLEYFLDNISADFSLQDPAKVNKIIMKSCKSAVKANDHLDIQEINALLKDLARMRNPFSCPHGRPTFIKLSKYEIEKLFKRV